MSGFSSLTFATNEPEAYLRLSTKEVARTDHCHSCEGQPMNHKCFFGPALKGAALSLPMSY